jgi:hypothetical protein
MDQDYDFSNLTETQQWVLTFQGWHLSTARLMPQPTPRQMAKLIKRGLVIEKEVVDRGLTFKTYEVPLDVHFAWCLTCKDEEE